MYNRILFIVVLLAVSLGSIAQQKNKRMVYLQTSMSDSFTTTKLKGFVTLMTEDSTVVDTMTCQGWIRDYWARFRVEARPAKYIIKAECDGYETGYANYELKHIARNQYFKVPDIMLKKRAQSDIYKEVDLDGVVVTGTKVKFTYRGDTLVYNASAFNVPDGSMLDALIKQLPGAELKSNGDIYINGRKIDYLTLNGKDFFKGNNKIMLDNLPYYTVQDLKVYDKSTERSLMLGKDVEKKEYVMDIALKRQYNRNYMFNIEAGYGTKDRHMERMFGLYLGDRTAAMVYGNINNVNENARPNDNGDWSPSQTPQGQTVKKEIGAGYDYRNRKGTVRENFMGNVEWNDVTDITHTAGESFASGGNLFSRNATRSRQDEVRMFARNQFMYTGDENKADGMWNSLKIKLRTDFNYADGTTSSSTRRATYDTDPSAYGDINSVLDSTFYAHRNAVSDNAINRSQTLGWRKFRSMTLRQELDIAAKLPWGDVINVNANASYVTDKPQDNFSLSANDYLREGTSDLRHVYTDSHSRTYSWQGAAEYRIALGDWNLTLQQSYRKRHQRSNNLNYRLERLNGCYADARDDMLSRLPSTRDSLLMAFDAHNSQTYRLSTGVYKGEANISFNKGSRLFILSLPYKTTSERITYSRAALDTVATRRTTFFEPSLYFSEWGKKLRLTANYGFYHQVPSLVSLMPNDNDINPLMRRISNPDLRNALTHNASFYIGLPMKDRQLSLNINGSISTDMQGTRTTYNTKTGAYTYMDDNIRSGNWNFGTTANYTGTLDRKKMLSLTEELSYNYTHSTDFDIAYDDASSELSRVYTSEIRNAMKLDFQKGELNVTLSGDAKWRHSTSNRQNFQAINAWDYSYGVKLAYKLFGIQLATDIKQYSRRGYGESSMNTDDLVWNASLRRSFAKGRIILTAEAFDLLHQLSNTTYTVNAQGRAEVWRNTIPNYCMVHLTYKLTKMPKK